MIDGIPKDLLDDWKGYEISQRIIRAMQDEKDALTQSMQLGHFVNTDDMESTFGASSKAIGKMEGLNEFFNLISGGLEDDI